MNPALIDEMSWAMAEVYAAVTDRLLVNLAHYFPYIQDSDEVMGSFEYQARMLAQMGQVTRESVDIITQSLGGADAALRQSLEAAIMDALKHEEPKLRKAAAQGLLGNPVTPELAPNMMQAFSSFYRQSADKLNLVNTVMLESTQAAYVQTVSDIVSKMNIVKRVKETQSILNIASGEVVTGVSTWNQAMRSAVNKMVENGLTGFVDHAGRRWSPEAYVAMDIRTTMFNTGRAAIWEREEEYGVDTYQVSSHNGARPLCYPWQGKVISRSDWSREIEDLDGNKVHVYAQSETSYGQAAGLFGVNCGHYPMTFIPGFSTLKGEPQDAEENAKTYEESQEQRALERKLREEKRDLATLKAQGASEEEIKAQRAKVKKASQDIDDFCDETGRTRRRNREGTPINAKFPPEGSYDPKEFPHDERDRINDWFKNGGNDNPPPSPTNIHLGPDDIPPQGQAQIPIQTDSNTQVPSDPPEIGDSKQPTSSGTNKPTYPQDFSKFSELTSEQTEILNKRYKSLDSKYHARVDKVMTTLQRDQERYDILFENRVKYEMEINPKMRRSTAEKRVRELLGERPEYGLTEYLFRGGDFNLEERTMTINPHALTVGNTVEDDIESRHKRIARNAKRVSEGRSVLPFSNAGDSLEATLIHEYGHAIDAEYKVTESPVFIDFYNLLSVDEIRDQISEYATTNEREFMAEAFLQSFMGDTQSDLSKRFMAILEEIVK